MLEGIRRLGPPRVLWEKEKVGLIFLSSNCKTCEATKSGQDLQTKQLLMIVSINIFFLVSFVNLTERVDDEKFCSCVL